MQGPAIPAIGHLDQVTVRRQDNLLGYSDIAGTLSLKLHCSQAVLPVNVWIYCDAFPQTLPHLLHSILPLLSALGISFDVIQYIFDCLALLVDSLNDLNYVWASRQTNILKVVIFLQFFNTLNRKYCKILLFISLTTSCESNLTAVCISQKTDKSCSKKSYKEYSASDISWSVYVAMWNCLSRWFICIVMMISLKLRYLYAMA